MSRIILSRHPDGRDHIVVGWDHPARGAFWQEWATAEEVAEAERKFDRGDDDISYDTITIAETGVKREGGMFPGIPLDKLADDMPEELRPLLTDRVMDLLLEHSLDRDSGYNARPIDLSEASATNS